MFLKEKVREVISEALKYDVYKADVSIKSTKDRNITEILDEMRGLCGVTIVNISVASKSLSEETEITICSLKFFLTNPSLKLHMNKLALSAKKIEGVAAFRILRVERIQDKK
tara:strand:+ start:711 stop:1046 length:336 start_codon:yes stop_codon:yes gene_type:complete